MKSIAWVMAGLVIGFVVALGALPDARGANDASAYHALDLFSSAFERVRADFVTPVDDGKLVDAAIQGMVSNLDPHSRYMDVNSYSDFQVETKGEMGGVGLNVTEGDGLIKVISPMDGTPAAKVGIKSGDIISAIDGNSIMDMALTDAVNKMRGPTGSKVTLTVIREGEKAPFNVTLTRAVIEIDAVSYKREGNVGYIRLPVFDEQTAGGLERSVRDLKKQIGLGIKGYVLDLRNNPGGLVDQAVQVSDDFLNSGEIVSMRGRHPEDTQRYDAKPGDITDGKPVVVLINAGTASASEIVSGALQDHRRATIIGMTSFGKGSVQTIMPLGENGGALALTTARYFTPSGNSIQARGITPDIAVSQGDEADNPMNERPYEADLLGHLPGDPVEKAGRNPPIVHAAPGKKYVDFQLSYALDLLNGKMTVASGNSVVVE